MELKLSSPKIWLYEIAVDFRKSINGLSEFACQHQSGHLQEDIFIFHNRACDKVKLLAWHGNGFVLLYKRLEKGRFTFCKTNHGSTLMNDRQLSWLLAGLDWQMMSHWKHLEYDDFY